MSAFNFKWLEPKVAIVEEENDGEYIAHQYLIKRNGLKLQLAKNTCSGSKWVLKQETDDGKCRTMFGKLKSYEEKFEKIRKQQEI